MIYLQNEYMNKYCYLIHIYKLKIICLINSLIQSVCAHMRVCVCVCVYMCVCGERERERFIFCC